ncbi:uncharacterized [Tachysurus ichikawai]
MSHQIFSHMPYFELSEVWDTDSQREEGTEMHSLGRLIECGHGLDQINPNKPCAMSHMRLREAGVQR